MGSRLLERFVPKAEASAAGCYVCVQGGPGSGCARWNHTWVKDQCTNTFIRCGCF
ncbi:hypothetical protein ACWCXK_00200 [Streptomyces sp. NPDC001739]|uniref:Uncharacterized protein n=2 Tax=Streptomyces TaxID=1883 RepID=A0ABS1MSJ7_9ACTN|nr:hypothetical protein [Streptomyces sp. 9-7]MBL1090754.1 hypothetical protein [Streptomyces sp. 9-7]